MKKSKRKLTSKTIVFDRIFRMDFDPYVFSFNMAKNYFINEVIKKGYVPFEPKEYIEPTRINTLTLICTAGYAGKKIAKTLGVQEYKAEVSFSIKKSPRKQREGI